MATAGRVAPLPRDKFVNGEPYEKLDVVEYNGNLYMAKKASSGVLPTDTEYWMLAVDLTGKLDTTGDTENNTVTFESGDETEPTEWKSVNVLASKEKHSSLFAKISTMFSNVRYLYKLLGTTDISALGSVTEAIATISGNVGNMKGISSSAAITTEGEYALDAREKNASVEGTLANQIDVLNSNLEYIPLKGGQIYGSEYISITRYTFTKLCGKIKFFNILADVIDADCQNKVVMTFQEPLLAAGFYDFIIYCPGSDCRAVLRKSSSGTEAEMIITGTLITGAKIVISGTYI